MSNWLMAIVNSIKHKEQAARWSGCCAASDTNRFRTSQTELTIYTMRAVNNSPPSPMQPSKAESHDLLGSILLAAAVGRWGNPRACCCRRAPALGCKGPDLLLKLCQRDTISLVQGDARPRPQRVVALGRDDL